MSINKLAVDRDGYLAPITIRSGMFQKPLGDRNQPLQGTGKLADGIHVAHQPFFQPGQLSPDSCHDRPGGRKFALLSGQPQQVVQGVDRDRLGNKVSFRNLVF